MKMNDFLRMVGFFQYEYWNIKFSHENFLIEPKNVVQKRDFIQSNISYKTESFEIEWSKYQRLWLTKCVYLM